MEIKVPAYLWTSQVVLGRWQCLGVLGELWRSKALDPKNYFHQIKDVGSKLLTWGAGRAYKMLIHSRVAGCRWWFPWGQQEKQQGGGKNTRLRTKECGPGESDYYWLTSEFLPPQEDKGKTRGGEKGRKTPVLFQRGFEALSLMKIRKWTLDSNQQDQPWVCHLCGLSGGACSEGLWVNLNDLHWCTESLHHPC